jgi:Na+/H+-translocating membrane pyrophosphatase
MSHEVRQRTDALDAAGNTTAAIGKVCILCLYSIFAEFGNSLVFFQQCQILTKRKIPLMVVIAINLPDFLMFPCRALLLVQLHWYL